jgi:pimeloyl-ACP methyl ester carboxylesterase
MERHATLGFHGPTEASTTPGYRAENEIGGIARFLQELQTKMNCPAPPRMPCEEKSWDLTLIGHSMGAIVVNHILRDFDDIPFRNVVYMASAGSVRDYEDSVFPYLEQHQATEVYHLTLHDFAEIRDQYGVLGPLELPPSGSLLVWIDNYFTHPPTLRDRTAGRFDNLMLFVGDTPEPVRERIHVKTFGVGRSLTMTDPQHHGDFNDFDGEPHECVAVDVSPEGQVFFFGNPLPWCEEPGHGNPCLASVGDHGKRKRECVYGDRFWRPTFWQTEVTDRPTRRPACLLNAD